jgi:hypothetical protein
MLMPKVSLGLQANLWEVDAGNGEGRVAQRIRAHGYEPWSRGFKSLLARRRSTLSGAGGPPYQGPEVHLIRGVHLPGGPPKMGMGPRPPNHRRAEGQLLIPRAGGLGPPLCSSLGAHSRRPLSCPLYPRVTYTRNGRPPIPYQKGLEISPPGNGYEAGSTPSTWEVNYLCRSHKGRSRETYCVPASHVSYFHSPMWSTWNSPGAGPSPPQIPRASHCLVRRHLLRRDTG